MSRFHFYRPQRSCGQGYVFTRVCDSVHRGGSPSRPPWDQADHPPCPPGTRQTPPRQGEPPQDQADNSPLAGRTPHQTKQTPLRPDRPPPGPGRHPPTKQTPPAGKTPPGPGRHPPRPSRPPPREEDCSIRSMSGRYASYWNAFL